MNSDVFTFEPLTWLLRGTLFFAAALLANHALRRWSAAWLAFYWRGAMLAGLGLVGVTLSGWQAPSLGIAAPGPVVSEAQPGDVVGEVITVVTLEAPVSEIATGTVARREAPNRSLPWRTLAWSAWGLGAFVVVLRWTISLYQRHRLVQEATAVKSDDTWFVLMREMAVRGRLPRLLRHGNAAVPCAWGLWRPTILLPAAADDWPLDHRRLALAHEWSHLRRGDPFWHMLSVLLLAFHWANPLAWLAVRRWRLAEEQAADDAALLHADASTYATLLVECARSTPPQLKPPNTMFPHFSMAHPSTVPQRVERVLNFHQDRRPPGLVRCSVFVLALAGAALGCLTLTPGLAAPDRNVPNEGDGSGAPAKPESKKVGGNTDEKAPAPPKPGGFRLSGGIDGSQVILDKLRTLVIPAVVLEQATIEEAVEFLRLKSKELDTTTTDPERKGVNFILQLPANGTVPKINSLNLKNVPLGVAVKAACDLVALRYRIEPYAVIISPPGSETELYTKVFRVPPDFLGLAGGAGISADGALQPRLSGLDVLKQAGVAFSEGTTAFFSPTTSLLTVRNTPSNLDIVSQFVESVSNRLPTMINLRAEFYRMPRTEALALADELDSVLDATEVLKKLRTEAAGTEKIKLLAAPLLQTRSGQRARVQSGRGQPEKKQENPAASKAPGTTTDDFQGCHFEADPILGPDGFTLDVTAQFTYGVPPKAPSERGNVGSLSTSTTIYAGQTRLVGTLSGGEQDDSVILIFLKATLARHH